MKRNFFLTLAVAVLAACATMGLASCTEDNNLDLDFFLENFPGTGENNDGTLHAELNNSGYSTIEYEGVTYTGQVNPFVMETGDINIALVNFSPEYPYPYIRMHVEKMGRNSMTVTVYRSIEDEDGSSDELETTTETLYKK